jgi:hypothetical protein
MASLIKAPNAPEDALSGDTDFDDKGVGMVNMPEKYISMVLNISITAESEISFKGSELAVVDSQNNKYIGTLWDDFLHAWVCLGAEYQPGQYEDYVIFILPASEEKGNKELWFKGRKIASISEVTRRSDLPIISSKTVRGRVIKESPLGDSVMIKEGKLVDVGGFMTLSGNRKTIIEPKSDQ